MGRLLDQGYTQDFADGTAGVACIEAGVVLLDGLAWCLGLLSAGVAVTV